MNLTEHAEADAQLVAIARDGRGARLLVPVGEARQAHGVLGAQARRRTSLHTTGGRTRPEIR